MSTQTEEMGVHGDASCTDVEAILAETITDNEALQEQIDLYKRTDAARQAELDALRAETARHRALVGHLQKTNSRLTDTQTGTEGQLEMLAEELEATETALAEALRHTVAPDALTHAAITQAQVMALYRAVSKVSRGPLPPSVAEEVTAGLPAIQAAMEAAGREVLEKTVRGAVRRRQRAQAASKKASGKASGKVGVSTATRRVAGQARPVSSVALPPGACAA